MEILKKWFIQDFKLKLLAFFSAVVLWAVVSISIYPTITRQIVNVPVEIDMEGSFAQSNYYEVTSKSLQFVTVVISGQRGQVGTITADDLVAKVDVSGVMMARTYSLEMNVECRDDRSFTVESVTPSTVTVTFDKMISRELPVTADLGDVHAAAGYTAGEPIVNPDTITITGPQNTVNSVTRAVVRINADHELTTTHEFTSSDVVLYNEKAVVANDNHVITYNRSSFTVQVPVSVRQTLPLDVNIINVPENFDVEYFESQLQFSITELDVAAPNDKVKDIESLNIGTINMGDVDVGKEFEFATENFLPEGYENLSPVDTVTVTCPSEGLTKRLIAVQAKDIMYINKPANFNFSTTASGLSLFFVGDETQMAELSSADITAQINLIDFDKQEGEHRMPVEILISSYDRVWCIGNGSIATPKIIVIAEAVPEPDPNAPDEEEITG